MTPTDDNENLLRGLQGTKKKMTPTSAGPRRQNRYARTTTTGSAKETYQKGRRVTPTNIPPTCYSYRTRRNYAASAHAKSYLSKVWGGNRYTGQSYIRSRWEVCWLWSRGAPFGTFLRGNLWSSSLRTCFVVVRPWWYGSGLVGGIFFFRSLAALATNFNGGYCVIFFFVCKPVVVGGRGRGRKFEVGMISILG